MSGEPAERVAATGRTLERLSEFVETTEDVDGHHGALDR